MRKRTALTLVEILVLIGIIALLVVILEILLSMSHEGSRELGRRAVASAANAPKWSRGRNSETNPLRLIVFSLSWER